RSRRTRDDRGAGAGHLRRRQRARGRHARDGGAGAAPRRRAGGAGRRGRGRRPRRGGAPSAGLRGERPGRGARRPGDQDHADPPRLGGDRAQLRRPDPGLRTVLHDRRPVRRARRGRPGAGVVHRDVPAVRVRPSGLRDALQREARPVQPSPRGAAGDLGGHEPKSRGAAGGLGAAESGGLATWIAVGGSPQSVVRAASYRLPLMLSIIGGPAQRFAPFADLYRRLLADEGTPTLPVAVHSPGHVAETDELAREQLYPHFKANRDRIGAERGWGPLTPEEYRTEIAHGALYVGSPETVARKIAATVRCLGLSRFDLKYAN